MERPPIPSSKKLDLLRRKVSRFANTAQKRAESIRNSDPETAKRLSYMTTALKQYAEAANKLVESTKLNKRYNGVDAGRLNQIKYDLESFVNHYEENIEPILDKNSFLNDKLKFQELVNNLYLGKLSVNRALSNDERILDKLFWKATQSKWKGLTGSSRLTAIIESACHDSGRDINNIYEARAYYFETYYGVTEDQYRTILSGDWNKALADGVSQETIDKLDCAIDDGYGAVELFKQEQIIYSSKIHFGEITFYQ